MNLTKRDVLELRRRLTKNGCSFSRIAGCYVGGNRTIITKFAQPFLDLEDDAFYKYLEIAKRCSRVPPAATCSSCPWPKMKTPPRFVSS